MSRFDSNNNDSERERIRRLIDQVDGLDRDVNINIPLPPIEDSPPEDRVRRLIEDRDNTGRGKNPRIDVPPLDTGDGGDDDGGGDDGDDGGDDTPIDPFEPDGSIFQLYKKFEPEDVFTARRQRITGGAWSKNKKTLTAFYTSSDQTSASSSYYYYDVYDEDPATNPDTSLVQFSLSYGHVTGGAAPSVFTDNQSPEPTKAIYKQFANVLLNTIAGDEKFEFNGFESDDFYAVLLSRNILKERVKPGSWQINLQSGSQEWSFVDESYTTNQNTSDFEVQNAYPIISGNLDVVPSETNYAIQREVDKGRLLDTITELADNDELEIATTSSDGLPIDSEKVTLSQSIWEEKIKNSAYPELSGAFASYGGQIDSSLWTAYSQSYNEVENYLFVSESSPTILTTTGSHPGFLSKMNEVYEFSGSATVDNPLSKVYYKRIFDDHFSKEIALRNEFFTEVGDQLTAVTKSYQETAGNDEGFGTFYPKLGLFMFNPSALVDVGLDNLQPTTSSDQFYDNINPFYESIAEFENVYIEEMVTNHYDVKLRRREFNFSNNPTFVSGSEKEIKSEFQENPVVYITKVGLYNDANECLVIARPSQPIKKTFSDEVIIRTKLDF